MRRVAVYAANSDMRRLAAQLLETDEQSNDANRHDSLAIELAFVETGCSGILEHGAATASPDWSPAAVVN
jgi:hypothetical protein